MLVTPTLLLAAALVVPDDIDPLHRGLAAARPVSHGVGSSPVGLIGFGTGWSGLFEVGRFELRFVDPTEELSQTRLTVELSSVRIGDDRIFDADASPLRIPTEDRLAVTYPVCTGIEERIVVLDRGVDHGFVLPRRPDGEEDLVFELEVECTSRMPEGTFHGGFLLDADGAVDVHVGGVTIVDARGRTSPGELRSTPTGWSYHVPRETLDTAEYPLHVDPVIVAVHELPVEHTIVDMDLAYNEATDVYGCLERRSGDGLVVMRLLDPGGSPVWAWGAAPLGWDNAFDLGRPYAIASIQARGQFLVAMRALGAVVLMTFDGYAPGGSWQAADVLYTSPYSLDLGGSADEEIGVAMLAWVDSQSHAVNVNRIEVDGSGLIDTFPTQPWVPPLTGWSAAGSNEPFSTVHRRVTVSEGGGRNQWDGAWVVAWWEVLRSPSLEEADLIGTDWVTWTGKGAATEHQGWTMLAPPRADGGTYGPLLAVDGDGLSAYLVVTRALCPGGRWDRHTAEPGARRATDDVHYTTTIPATTWADLEWEELVPPYPGASSPMWSIDVAMTSGCALVSMSHGWPVDCADGAHCGITTARVLGVPWNWGLGSALSSAPLLENFDGLTTTAIASEYVSLPGSWPESFEAMAVGAGSGPCAPAEGVYAILDGK